MKQAIDEKNTTIVKGAIINTNLATDFLLDNKK